MIELLLLIVVLVVVFVIARALIRWLGARTR